MARMNLWLWLSKNLGRAFWEEAIEELDDELKKERKENKRKIEELKAIIERDQDYIDTLSGQLKETEAQLEEEKKAYKSLCERSQITLTKLTEAEGKLKESDDKYNELSKELEITAHLRDDLHIKVHRLKEEHETVVICSNKLLEKYNEQEKMLFSLKGVNGRYKKQIARLKEEIAELQNDLDDVIEPMM